MIWQISPLIALTAYPCFIGIGIAMIHTLYETEKNPKEIVSIWFICLCLITLVTVVASEKFNLFITQEMISLLSVFLLPGYFAIFKEAKPKELIFTFLFINNTLLMIFLFSRTFAALFGSDLTYGTADQVFLTTYFITMFFFLAEFGLELRQNILDGLAVFADSFMNLLAFSFFNYMLLLFAPEMGSAWAIPDTRLVIRNFIVIIAQITGYVLVFHSLSNVSEKIIVSTYNKYAVQQIAQYKRYFENLTSKVNQTRMYNHNMKYIITGLTALNEKHDFEGIEKFLSTLSDEMPKTLPVWSKVPEIDAILASCSELCQQEGIDFECQVVLPKEKKVSTLHLCIILGNCLQNAFEAAKNVEADRKRYINLVCFPAADKLVIRCENSSSNKIEIDESGNLVTTKTEDVEMHGFGVSSIQSIANRYYGNCTWESDNTYFRINVLLSL